jgi:hypothetical protein
MKNGQQYMNTLSNEIPAISEMLRRFSGYALTHEQAKNLFAQGKEKCDAYKENLIKPMSETDFNRVMADDIFGAVVGNIAIINAARNSDEQNLRIEIDKVFKREGTSTLSNSMEIPNSKPAKFYKRLSDDKDFNRQIFAVVKSEVLLYIRENPEKLDSFGTLATAPRHKIPEPQNGYVINIIEPEQQVEVAKTEEQNAETTEQMSPEEQTTEREHEDKLANVSCDTVGFEKAENG